jgi:UDP-N-acetylmuramyl tripeptide synthase
MKTLKRKIKNFSRRISSFRQGIHALAHASRLGFPARKIAIIAIVGSGQKAATSSFVAKALSTAGTVAHNGGEKWLINGAPWQQSVSEVAIATQDFLQAAVRAKCTYAILEFSAKDMAAGKQYATECDILVFTGLNEDHTDEESGDSYDYQALRSQLFASLKRTDRKSVSSISVPTIIVANGDNIHAPYYLHVEADRKATYGLADNTTAAFHLRADDVQVKDGQTTYKVANNDIIVASTQANDVTSSLAALTLAEMLGLPIEPIKKAFAEEPKA